MGPKRGLFRGGVLGLRMIRYSASENCYSGLAPDFVGASPGSPGLRSYKAKAL